MRKRRPKNTAFDALVAEKVFGEKFEFDSRFGDYNRPWAEDPIALEPCPAYSSEITAAWAVVEKLLSTLPHEDIHMEHWKDGESSGWRVSTCFESGEWRDWVEAETLPRAICEAALKGLG